MTECDQLGAAGIGAWNGSWNGPVREPVQCGHFVRSGVQSVQAVRSGRRSVLMVREGLRFDSVRGLQFRGIISKLKSVECPFSWTESWETLLRSECTGCSIDTGDLFTMGCATRSGAPDRSAR